MRENIEGRGPCYLKTKGIKEELNNDLKKAYLNMAPSQTLKWIESGKNPSEENVEIEGTEPYIVGGHTASGYWVDTNRKTTIEGLYAAGDVAGGCPQKYVTGALVEGEIAALSIIKELSFEDKLDEQSKHELKDFEKEFFIKEKKNEVEKILNEENDDFNVEELEEAMQKVMDTYAGGIGSNYQYNEKQLNMAYEKIENLILLTSNLSARDMHELMFVYELKERLTLCLSVIAHLKARKETRWHSFAENLDYPQKSDSYLKYVNSKVVDGKIQIIFRELVGGKEKYEHKD